MYSILGFFLGGKECWGEYSQWTRISDMKFASSVNNYSQHNIRPRI